MASSPCTRWYTRTTFFRADQHLTLALIQHPWPLRWLFMIPLVFMHLHPRLHHAAISLDRLLLQYFGTTGPQAAGNLSTTNYDGLFTLYKVIYPNYAARHYTGEINTWRWLSSNILDPDVDAPTPTAASSSNELAWPGPTPTTISWHHRWQAIWWLWTTMASSPSTRWSTGTTYASRH